MRNSHSIIAGICVVSLLAIAVVAGEPQADAEITVLNHDFAVEPIFYGATAAAFGGPYELPAGSKLVGLGYTDLYVEVFPSGGFPNHAGHAMLGCLVQGQEGAFFLVTIPFEGVMEGAGIFGPVSAVIAVDHTPIEPFAFRVMSVFGDPFGTPSGVFNSGVVYAEFETGVVAAEATSLSAVKALFR